MFECRRFAEKGDDRKTENQKKTKKGAWEGGGVRIWWWWSCGSRFMRRENEVGDGEGINGARWHYSGAGVARFRLPRSFSKSEKKVCIQTISASALPPPPHLKQGNENLLGFYIILLKKKIEYVISLSPPSFQV